MIPPILLFLDVKFQWCCATASTAELSRLAPGPEGWHPPLLFLPVPERSATGRPTEWRSISTLGSHGHSRWNLWRSKMKHDGFSWVFIDVWQHLDSHRFSYVFHQFTICSPPCHDMEVIDTPQDLAWSWFEQLRTQLPWQECFDGGDFSGVHFGFQRWKRVWDHPYVIHCYSML